MFEFAVSGLVSLGYVEHVDFNVSYDYVLGDVGERAIVQLDVSRKGSTSTMRQYIRYMAPNSPIPAYGVELLIVDEAAALPIPCVSSLIGPYVVVLASTVTGYEGTGRALQLKLMSRLRSQLVSVGAMLELTLATPIRYAEGDSVEAWLHRTLCLDSPSQPLSLTRSLPPPEHCGLYHVDRDALFSCHPIGEAFLHRIMALYTAAHYKNSPNDLQILCDAPAHRLFVLLGPRVVGTSRDVGAHATPTSDAYAAALAAVPAVPSTSHASTDDLPDVLVVLQIAFEGALDRETVATGLSSSEIAAGDLIPWTLAHHFCDLEFPSLSGARIVRIAAHSEALSMGYGTRALNLFIDYVRRKPGHAVVDEMTCSNNDDTRSLIGCSTLKTCTGKVLPPLLVPLAQLMPPQIDWLGVSFGLTPQLLNFWDRGGFQVVYVRQTQNQVTGEHTVIVLCAIGEESNHCVQSPCWLMKMVTDARCRFVRLLASCFRTLDPFMCLRVLGHAKLERLTDNVANACADANVKVDVGPHTSRTLADEAVGIRFLLTGRDIQRLDSFSCSSSDHRSISDIVPTIAELIFTRKIRGIVLPTLQAVILLGVGLQRRELPALADALKVTRSQAFALYGKIVRRTSSHLREHLVLEQPVNTKAVVLTPEDL